MDQRTRWRIGMGLCVAGIVFLSSAWSQSPGASLVSFLYISLPIVVLIYAASFSALRGYIDEVGPPSDRSGSKANKLHTIGTVMVLAGFSWICLVSSFFAFIGQWKFGAIGFAIATVFVLGALPGRLSNLRIIIVFIGLVVASVFFVLLDE